LVIWSPRVRITVIVISAELIFVAVGAYEAVAAASPRTLSIICSWMKIHTTRPFTDGVRGTRGGLIPQTDGSVGENNAHAEVGSIGADNAGLTTDMCGDSRGKKYHKHHLMAPETHG
jgi:hypothetical protein